MESHQKVWFGYLAKPSLLVLSSHHELHTPERMKKHSFLLPPAFFKLGGHKYLSLRQAGCRGQQCLWEEVFR
jgi:hypothetical protein